MRIVAEPKRRFIERLFAQHRHALQGFFVRRVRDRGDAADLVQEVYARMLRVKDTQTIENPEGYLYAVASHLVREHLVLSQRAATGQHALGVQDDGDDDRDGLDQLFDADVRTRRLQEVLAELPAKCRAAVYMKYQHGLTYEEIAVNIGVSSHMVQKYLGQALAHCRKRMTRLR
jgi:RNA polymerase sigma factor (sigma-70 family)